MNKCENCSVNDANQKWIGVDKEVTELCSQCFSTLLKGCLDYCGINMLTAEEQRERLERLEKMNFACTVNFELEPYKTSFDINDELLSKWMDTQKCVEPTFFINDIVRLNFLNSIRNDDWTLHYNNRFKRWEYTLYDDVLDDHGNSEIVFEFEHENIRDVIDEIIHNQKFYIDFPQNFTNLLTDTARIDFIALRGTTIYCDRQEDFNIRKIIDNLRNAESYEDKRRQALKASR